MADRVADDFPCGYARYQTGDAPIEPDRRVTAEQRIYHSLLRHDAALAWSRAVGADARLPHLLDYAETPQTVAGWEELRGAVRRRAAGLFPKAQSHGHNVVLGRQKRWVEERVLERIAAGEGGRQRFDALVRRAFAERPRNIPP